MATYNTFRELANYLGVDPDKPTPESQKLVYDWMQQNPEYEAGSVTNKYMEGYEPPVEQPAETQPVDTPPQDVPPVETQTPDAMAGDPRYQPKQPEQTQPAQSAQPVDRSTASDAISRWTPVAAQVAAFATPFSGVDPTGESAGARALAGQNQKTASDLSKIVQWNKQRATDNTLADKIAAAQASGKWKQNAKTNKR